jgi:hypothetical protein
MEVPVTHRRPALVTAAALTSAIGALSPATALGQGAFVAASVCPDDNHAKFHACALFPAFGAGRVANDPEDNDLAGFRELSALPITDLGYGPYIHR